MIFAVVVVIAVAVASLQNCCHPNTFAHTVVPVLNHRFLVLCSVQCLYSSTLMMMMIVVVAAGGSIG